MSGSTPLQLLQSKLEIDHTSNPAVYSLRYLLARRLSRLGRYADAREFYPPALLPKFDELVAALKLGETAREGKDSACRRPVAGREDRALARHGNLRHRG